MNVFISWSGELSKAIALLLRDWLPNILQFVKPYVSAEDMEKGAVWFTNISENLKACEYGIICLTADNLESRWIYFEAGAIASRFDMKRISALLVDLAPEKVAPPLGLFQHTEPTREDMFRLVQTLNKLSSEALGEFQLLKAFEQWWPEFEERLSENAEDDFGLRDHSVAMLESAQKIGRILQDHAEHTAFAGIKMEKFRDQERAETSHTLDAKKQLQKDAKKFGDDMHAYATQLKGLNKEYESTLSGFERSMQYIIRFQKPASDQDWAQIAILLVTFKALEAKVTDMLKANQGAPQVLNKLPNYQMNLHKALQKVSAEYDIAVFS